MREYKLFDSVPESVTKSKTWKLAIRTGHSRCFYSNMECLFYDVPISTLHLFPRAATREHLIPKQRCNFTDLQARDNLVICSSFMNNLLGDAPLMVKFEIRSKILDNDLKDLSIIENLTKHVLDAYRVDNRFPWQVASFNHREANHIRRYMKHLREMEQIAFKAILKLRTLPAEPLIDWSNDGRTDVMAARERTDRPEHLSEIPY